MQSEGKFAKKALQNGTVSPHQMPVPADTLSASQHSRTIEPGFLYDMVQSLTSQTARLAISGLNIVHIVLMREIYHL